MKHLVKKIKNVNGCLEYQGSLDSCGYSKLCRKGKFYSGHRYILKCLGVEIPGGYEVDHLCNNRKCVNPIHLRVCTRVENMSRVVIVNGNTYKTHCKRGHEFTIENTHMKQGKRSCRECRRSYEKDRYIKRKRGI